MAKQYETSQGGLQLSEYKILAARVSAGLRESFLILTVCQPPCAGWLACPSRSAAEAAQKELINNGDDGDHEYEGNYKHAHTHTH